MTEAKVDITRFRKERGWSQEKLAAISGLSERTIQRIEKDGSCSLDSKLALASAFELSPKELETEDDSNIDDYEYKTDWGGAFGLLILGLAFPAVILLTGTNGKWEMVSFFTVIGLTVTMSIMTYGFKQTYKVFDNTSWIVKYPTYANGLSKQIVHANSIINNAYIVGAVTSIVTGITIAIHKPELLDSSREYITISVKPVIYAILFSEFWFRPYKRKMEKMLKDQMDS